MSRTKTRTGPQNLLNSKLSFPNGENTKEYIWKFPKSLPHITRLSDEKCLQDCRNVQFKLHDVTWDLIIELSDVSIFLSGKDAGNKSVNLFYDVEAAVVGHKEMAVAKAIYNTSSDKFDLSSLSSRKQLEINYLLNGSRLCLHIRIRRKSEGEINTTMKLKEFQEKFQKLETHDISEKALEHLSNFLREVSKTEKTGQASTSAANQRYDDDSSTHDSLSNDSDTDASDESEENYIQQLRSKRKRNSIADEQDDLL